MMERESGILFQGDGRALLAQDLNDDCRPDLIASFNSGKPLALINQSGQGVPLCLKISGDPGNLRGTGSRLSLLYRNGRRKSCQLSLGSSYLSSPEPQVFLAQTEDNPIQSVTIHSPLGVKSTHSLKGSSGIVKIRVPTR